MYWNRLLGVLGVLLAVLTLGTACGGEENKPPDGHGGGGVECSADVDCPAERPHCDAGACVACLGNADCPTDTPSCIEGSCSRCTGNESCTLANAPVCDESTGLCVGCIADGDCGGGHCSPDRNCVQCLADSHCAAGESCVDGACVQSTTCAGNEDCEEGELCVFPESGAPVGKCGAICDPQQPDAGTCDENEGCSLVGFDAENTPVGACVPFNGGAGEQEPCDPEGCEAGLLCVNYGTDERCSSTCDASEPGSCGEGFTCTELEFTAPEGATIGVCVPELDFCETDADCDADEVCTLTVADDGGLDMVCARAAGDKRGGERCSANAECASNFCLSGQGVCYGTCTATEGCAEGSACVQVTFTLPDDTTDQAPACFPTCTDDASCNPGQVCSTAFNLDDSDIVLVCNPQQGLKGAGAVCSSSTECKSGYCANGLCFGICDGDDDCATNTECASLAQRISTGPDGLWGSADDRFYSVPICRGIVCAGDGECGTSWACVPEADQADPTLSSVMQRCAPAAGNLAGGQSCTSASQCSSGLCFDPRVLPEDCDNGVDDDGDGQSDCDDLDCHTACHQENDCGNGIDDDHDGVADCRDGDCYWDCRYERNCADSNDNDSDGLVDCADPDCASVCGLTENDCSNGRDDDGDGFADCRDDDCRWATDCNEDWMGGCDNGLDDDGDGWTDCVDPSCRWDSPCNTRSNEGDTAAHCNDGLDNDGDGTVDCADPGCMDTFPCSEASRDGGAGCTDGLDNDNDGRADCRDNDCRNHAACNESGRCADGLDNDGDRLVDCADDNCSNDPACNENRCAGGNCCTDGLDNDGDGGVDCTDYDCFWTASCNEQYCPGGNCCADGLDSDNDGDVDCADSDCSGNSRCTERNNCGDMIDNDGDGQTDCADADCYGSSNCPGRICFGACGSDADCASTASCADASYPVQLGGLGAWGYVDACVPLTE